MKLSPVTLISQGTGLFLVDLKTTKYFDYCISPLNRAGALIKTYENLDSPFAAHTRTLFIIYDN